MSIEVVNSNLNNLNINNENINNSTNNTPNNNINNNNNNNNINFGNNLEATQPEVSTTTIIVEISAGHIDLPIIQENLPHHPCGQLIKERCPTCKDGEKNIISIRMKDCKNKGKPKNTPCPRKNSRPKSFFFNQLTIDISPMPGRVISTKLFVDGNIQMAGCKNEDEAIQTVKILIEHLKAIGNITQPGTMEMILTPERHLEVLKAQTTMSPTEFRNYLFDIKAEKLPRGATKLPRYKINYIKKGVEYPENLKLTNFKIAMINSDFKFYTPGSHNEKVGVFIDRNMLLQILDEYRVYYAPYESSRYPGVNIKYRCSCECIHGCKEKNNLIDCIKNNHEPCITENYEEGDEIEHKCLDYNTIENCVNLVKKKKRTNGCVTVSILCFQQGKVILTGARSKTQLMEAYEFIVLLYKKHYERLRHKMIESDSSSCFDSDSDNDLDED